MLEHIAYILGYKCHTTPQDLLLVGVSGGPDSLCLLHGLHKLGQPVMAVHLDHGLRPGSDNEAAQVAEFCRNNAIRFVAEQLDVKAYANENACSLEEAGRVLRYAALFRLAETHSAAAVVVGHTADDQVETILMHLLRGTGLDGLGGMSYRSLPNPWSKSIPLLRPLLSTWRLNILDYISENQLTPIYDQSNEDRTFLRNRIRHELLPELESYNPRIRSAFLHLGEHVQQDLAIIHEQVERAWRDAWLRDGEGWVEFRTQAFRSLPLPLQRHVLRRAIDQLHPGIEQLDYECIERAVRTVMSRKPSTRIDLVGGLKLFKEADHFWVAADEAILPMDQFPHISPSLHQDLVIPGEIELPDGRKLTATLVRMTRTRQADSHANQDLFQAWIDQAVLAGGLFVRTRLAGDTFQPLGMGGQTMKLSDLMVNLKIPARARRTWPLICAEQGILWVPGCRLSHVGRITPHTKQAVHLALSRDLPPQSG